MGFHLGHRDTYDLDLFTLEDIVTEGFATVTEVARQLGASIESLQTSPDFRRLLLRRETEAIVIDLVREQVVQAKLEKLLFGEIRVDPPKEILANKLCALLSRSEIRDLVDVRALESIGYRVEDALEAAHQKDRGLTAAQLSWVLSQIEFGDDLIPPGSVLRSDLQTYLTALIERLANVAFPN